MYDEYDDGSEGGFSLGRKIALGVGVLAVVALGWFVVTNLTGGKGGGSVQQGTTTSAAPATSAAGARNEDPSVAPSGDDEASTPTTAAAAPVTDAPSTTAAAAAPTTEAPTTLAPTTTAAPPTTAAPTAPTNPDGTPAWVVTIYDESSITLNGQVPDQESKQKLQDLAVANAKPGQATTVSNNLTINPAVPRDVGVRVVELTSVRFPDGQATITPEQAAELDRVANVLNLLPNVTALVIGHADQRGGEAQNYVLSKNRADAVVDHMIAKGIDPARLSARAVGENDLLTLNDDAAALALNKRTEFVLFGLLR